ncbi:MAG: DNA replication/repair protein RecF [Clostridia bacterium]|nr:DNA replication/repair protein RecF [Clostridia bacterium]
MLCKKVELCNFRNAESEIIEFDNGINVLHGENAQGKTNLLEAIYYVSLGKSFRTTHDTEIIRFGEEYASVSLDYESAGRDQNITMRMSSNTRQRKAVTHNGVKITKLSELVGSFRAVLFSPDHLQMIKDGPSLRRNYMDVAISQIRPMYLHSLQKYNKILLNRNKLIKNAEEDRATFDSTIDFWSAQLAHEAAIIAKMRAEYVARSGEIIADFYKRMCQSGEIDETPEFIYAGSAKQENELYFDIETTEKNFLRLLNDFHEREIAAGATLYGIHKDDITINLNGKNTRLYSSQGQQRSLALAMKLAEGEICKMDCGEYPVFLFDDVFSELDASRRKNLLREITDRQVIITSCENDMDLSVPYRRIEVVKGKYRS